MESLTSSSNDQSAVVKRNTESLLASTPGELRLSSTENSNLSSFPKEKNGKSTKLTKRSLNFDSDSEDSSPPDNEQSFITDRKLNPQDQEFEFGKVVAAAEGVDFTKVHCLGIRELNSGSFDSGAPPPDPEITPVPVCFNGFVETAFAATSTPVKSCLRDKTQGSTSASKSTSTTKSGTATGGATYSVSFAGGTTVEEFSVHSATPEQEDKSGFFGNTPVDCTPGEKSHFLGEDFIKVKETGSQVLSFPLGTTSAGDSARKSSCSQSPHRTSAAVSSISFSQPYNPPVSRSPVPSSSSSTTTISTPLDQEQTRDVTTSSSVSSEYPQLLKRTPEQECKTDRRISDCEDLNIGLNSNAIHNVRSLVHEGSLSQSFKNSQESSSGVCNNSLRVAGGADNRDRSELNHSEILEQLQTIRQSLFAKLPTVVAGAYRKQFNSTVLTPQFGDSSDSFDRIYFEKPGILGSFKNLSMASQPTRNAPVPVVPQRVTDIRAIFDRLHSEQSRFNGVGSYIGGEEAEMLTHLRLDGLSEEEIRWLSSLPADKLREMYEAEVYRRLHCERKITTLQRQLMQLEQRLTVMETINGVQRDSLGDLEGILSNLLSDLVHQETELSQRFETLLSDCETMKARMNSANTTLGQRNEELQTMRRSHEEMQLELDRARQLLRSEQDANAELGSKCDSLIQTNERLKHKVDGYEKEKTEWFNREKTMYTDVCALEKFLTEQKEENTRLQERATLAEQKRLAETAKVEADCKRELEDGVAQTRDRLRTEFESRIARLNQDWENLMQKHADRYKELLAKYEDTVERLKRAERSKRSLQQRLIHEFQGILKLKYDEIQDLVEETAERPSLNSTSNESVHQQRMPSGGGATPIQPTRRIVSKDGHHQAEQPEVATTSSSEMDQLELRKRELQRFIEKIHQKHSGRDSGLPISSRSVEGAPPF